MRVYIAGPISGLGLQERQEFFARKKAQLQLQGHDVVNPFECHPIGVPWEEALRSDIEQLVKCDAICLTPGWERSRGVQLELQVALPLGLKVMIDNGE